MAWGQVVERIAEVQRIHFYKMGAGPSGFAVYSEGWRDGEKGFVRDYNSGGAMYDDGQIRRMFDEHGTQIGTKPSMRNIQNLFLVTSRGLLTADNEHLNKQTPTSVGEDFLVYVFDAPDNCKDWIENVSITVGRTSRLPIQIKWYMKPADDGRDRGYFLHMFDYEEAEKPAGFFQPPTERKRPHGSDEVVLDGEETTIDIEGVLGISQAVVRLHNKKEKAGKPVFSLDVAFVTPDGHGSQKRTFPPLALNEGLNCGTVIKDHPDGLHRNVKFTPVITPTKLEGVYKVELSCWVKVGWEWEKRFSPFN